MPSVSLSPWWIRLSVSLLAGLRGAVVSAVTLTVIDLYLAGHGLRTLNRSWPVWPRAGISLNPAGLVFVVATVVSALVKWRRLAAGN